MWPVIIIGVAVIAAFSVYSENKGKQRERLAKKAAEEAKKQEEEREQAEIKEREELSKLERKFLTPSKVVEKWSAVIDGAGGRSGEFLGAVEQRAGEAGIPGLAASREAVFFSSDSEAFFHDREGARTKDVLVFSADDAAVRDFRMYVAADDFAGRLSVSSYLALETSGITNGKERFNALGMDEKLKIRNWGGIVGRIVKEEAARMQREFSAGAAGSFVNSPDGADFPPNALALGSAEKGGDLKGVRQEDRLTHFYIVGASGTGKTKFLEYMIRQDIRNGSGFGVIDPHGDLAESVKKFLAGSGGDLAERVVLIDPADKARTVSFNPLELPDGMGAAQQAKELVSAFKKIYGDSWGPRLEEIFRNSLIALIENGLTLLELSLILKNDGVRAKLLRGVKNETCREFFEEDYAKWSERTKLEWTQSTLNKVDAFLSDGRMRQMFASAESSFDLRDIMDSRKILIVNLSKGGLGEDSSSLLGSLLLTKIQAAAMKRGGVAEKERIPFYLYIDEFQNFATENFTQVLDEARKYRLALALAHQNLEQASFKLRPSLLNCGLIASFRVARPDAEVLAKEFFAGLVADPDERERYIQQLQGLPPRTCFVKNNIKGGVIKISVPEAPAGRGGAPGSGMGERYLRRRDDIDREYQKRRKALIGGEDDESFYDSF